MARRKRIRFRTTKYDTKSRIIERIRFLQKRNVPSAKFYNQLSCDELKVIRRSAKLDNDMWLFDLAKIKKIAKAKKQ